jgi:hypothetical protein
MNIVRTVALLKLADAQFLSSENIQTSLLHLMYVYKKFVQNPAPSLRRRGSVLSKASSFFKRKARIDMSAQMLPPSNSQVAPTKDGHATPKAGSIMNDRPPMVPGHTVNQRNGRHMKRETVTGELLDITQRAFTTFWNTLNPKARKWF